MRCTNCGKQMPDNVQICPECGAEYYFPMAPAAPSGPISRPAQPEPPKKHTGLVIAIAVIMSLMIVGVNALLGIGAIYLSGALTAFPPPNIDGSSQPSSGVNPQEADYAAAMALLENRQYDAALAAFRALDDYRDSKAKANDCAFAAAGQCLDRGDHWGSMDYISYMHKSQRPIIYERYYALLEANATALIQKSLKTNFYDMFHSMEAFLYDPLTESHYLELYNNTIYRYTLSYQINYYDRSGNLIHQSQMLTADIGGARYTRVWMPADTSFEWARRDVEYRIQDVDYQLNDSPKYAVRLLDDQGVPIHGALVSITPGDSILIGTGGVGESDIHGLFSLRREEQKKTFRVSVNGNLDYNYVKETHEFQADGIVHDVVVLRDTPEFSVTVLDTEGYPIPGVTMHLTSTDVFGVSKYNKTDDNGYACWYDVDMSHTYKLSYLTKPPFVTIDAIHFEEEHHITVVMEREKPKNDTPSFTVTVVDKNGNPIAGVILYLAYSDVIGGDWYERTDKNGNACWYDKDPSYTYKVFRIRKEGYACPEEVHFAPGENHLIIVLEEESEA